MLVAFGARIMPTPPSLNKKGKRELIREADIRLLNELHHCSGGHGSHGYSKFVVPSNWCTSTPASLRLLLA